MIPDNYLLMKVKKLTESYGSYKIGDYILVRRNQYVDKVRTYIEFIRVNRSQTGGYYRISSDELSVVNNDVDLNMFLDYVNINNMNECIESYESRR